MHKPLFVIEKRSCRKFYSRKAGKKTEKKFKFVNYEHARVFYTKNSAITCMRSNGFSENDFKVIKCKLVYPIIKEEIG